MIEERFSTSMMQKRINSTTIPVYRCGEIDNKLFMIVDENNLHLGENKLEG